jgi:acid phosphatase
LTTKSIFTCGFLGLALALASLSAQQPGPHFAPVAPGERIANLDSVKDKLKRYHECTCTCGCYTKDLDIQSGRALAFLHNRAAHVRPNQKLAVVLDIDETTLSNYSEMLDRGFAYDSKAFAAWVDTAAAPAIPGTLKLVKEAERLGVNVVFLTGRPEAQRASTERNLHGAGFDGWQKLILRPLDEQSLNAQEYKSAQRKKLVDAGFKIILNVGDQWSDLRGAPEAEYSVKYPDPYYFLK